MKVSRVAALALLFVLVGSIAFAADPHPQAPTNVLWEKMKKLDGTWVSKSATTTYHITSGGSAMIAVQQVPGEGEMTTVFHPVGKTVVATHYCLAMNQPTLVAMPGPDMNTITYKFRSIDNLATPESGHMRGLVINLVDADHHSEKWTYREKGKETSETFAMERKK